MSDVNLLRGLEMAIQLGRWCLVENVTESKVITLIDLFEQDGLECWIKFLADVLDKTPSTKLNGHFQASKQIDITHFENIETILSSAVAEILDEFICLALWINHERPSSRFEHDNTIFN
jgi:hypothetical protein